MDKEAIFQHEIEKEVKFMGYRNRKVMPTIKESVTESADYRMTYNIPLSEEQATDDINMKASHKQSFSARGDHTQALKNSYSDSFR